MLEGHSALSLSAFALPANSVVGMTFGGYHCTYNQPIVKNADNSMVEFNAGESAESPGSVVA
jgi:hypothetical protein